MEVFNGVTIGTMELYTPTRDSVSLIISYHRENTQIMRKGTLDEKDAKGKVSKGRHWNDSLLFFFFQFFYSLKIIIL